MRKRLEPQQARWLTRHSRIHLFEPWTAGRCQCGRMHGDKIHDMEPFEAIPPGSFIRPLVLENRMVLPLLTCVAMFVAMAIPMGAQTSGKQAVRIPDGGTCFPGQVCAIKPAKKQSVGDDGGNILGPEMKFTEGASIPDPYIVCSAKLEPGYSVCDEKGMASIKGQETTVVKLSDEEYSNLQKLRQAVVDEEKRLAVKYGARMHKVAPFGCPDDNCVGSESENDRYTFHQQFLLIDKATK